MKTVNEDVVGRPTYQVGPKKTASTLTVFKDTRYGIYVTYFGMRLRRTLLTFDFYLTFELLTTGQHTVMKIVS